MHLLHLVEPWSPARAERLDRLSGTDAAVEGAAACTRASSYHTQAIVLVGPRSAEIRARALGARTFDTVCPINGSRRHGVALIRRLLAHRTTPERIVVWSSHLESWAKTFELPLVKPWETRLQPASGRVPGIRQSPHLRAPMRRALGIPDDAVVVALADDPPMEADLWQFVTILSMLEAAGAFVYGIAPTAAAQRGRGRRLFRAMGLVQGLLLIDEPVWEVSPAIDVAIVGGGMWARAIELGEFPAPSASEFAWARVMAAERMMQRAVPTVTTDRMAVPDALKTALAAADARPSSIAGKVLTLAESAAARREVEELLGRGVPAHAKTLASRLLWQVTAVPGESEPGELMQESHG